MTSPVRAAGPALPSLLLALALVALVLSGCDDSATPAPVDGSPNRATQAPSTSAQAARYAEVTDPVAADNGVPPAAPMGDRMIAPEPEVAVLSTEGVREFRKSFRAFLDSASPDSRKAVLEGLGRRFMGEVEDRVREKAGPGLTGPSEEQVVFAILEVLEGFDGLEAETFAQQFRSENPDWTPGREDEFGHGSEARRNANESAAIATLKNISSAQSQCQASGVIDVNNNGAGEYGVFAELSGAAPIRGTEDFISPPVLSTGFGNVQHGRVTRSGYVFQMWLPRHAGGIYSPENPDGGIDTYSVDAATSEVVWRCYAWPLEKGVSGTRVFVVDQGGDVLTCSNRMNWSGVQNGPAANAAAGTELWSLSTNAQSLNGEMWTVVH